MVGGVENGVPFLGTVGMIGVHFTDAHIATGARASHAAAAALPACRACWANRRLPLSGACACPYGAVRGRVWADAGAAAVPRAAPAGHERGGGHAAAARRPARMLLPVSTSCWMRALHACHVRRAAAWLGGNAHAGHCSAPQVCYYRDKQTTNKFQIAKVTSEGVSISDPFALETQWGYQVRSYVLIELESCSLTLHLSHVALQISRSLSCLLQAFVNPAANAVGTW